MRRRGRRPSGRPAPRRAPRGRRRGRSRRGSGSGWRWCGGSGRRRPRRRGRGHRPRSRRRGLASCFVLVQTSNCGSSNTLPGSVQNLRPGRQPDRGVDRGRDRRRRPAPGPGAAADPGPRGRVGGESEHRLGRLPPAARPRRGGDRRAARHKGACATRDRPAQPQLPDPAGRERPGHRRPGPPPAAGPGLPERPLRSAFTRARRSCRSCSTPRGPGSAPRGCRPTTCCWRSAPATPSTARCPRICGPATGGGRGSGLGRRLSAAAGDEPDRRPGADRRRGDDGGRAGGGFEAWRARGDHHQPCAEPDRRRGVRPARRGAACAAGRAPRRAADRGRPRRRHHPAPPR